MRKCNDEIYNPLAVALLSSNSSAKNEDFKPLVLLNGSLNEGSYPYMINKDVTRFEEVSLIPVERKRTELDREADLSELRKVATHHQ